MNVHYEGIDELAKSLTDKHGKAYNIAVEAHSSSLEARAPRPTNTEQILQAAELALAQQRHSCAALLSPNRKAYSLPTSLASSAPASAIASPRLIGRQADDASPRIKAGAVKPAERVSLGTLISHQSTIDYLLGQLFRAEHDLRKSKEAVQTLEQRQEKELANMSKIVRRIAELDGQFDDLNTQLDHKLRRKADVLEFLHCCEEQCVQLQDRITLMAAESSAKSDVIASLKCSLYLAVEHCPEALADPAISQCFSA